MQEALTVFNQEVRREKPIDATDMTVTVGSETWTLDSQEEFFAQYRKPCDQAAISAGRLTPDAFSFSFMGTYSIIHIELEARSKIERVFEVFERNVERSRMPITPTPAPSPPTIFIGHGRSAQWRDLKDHLTDKQGYRVTAYEVGARAGHTIRDILDDLLVNSSFALLVLTAEDETSTGQMRARQNVVHELGLFQGKLGFSRAIAVVEKGTELMSNLDGVQQLQFSSGSIAEVYGDVIATLRREFGDIR